MVGNQRPTSLLAEQAQMRDRQQPGDEWPAPGPSPHQGEVEQCQLQECAPVGGGLLS